MEHVVLVVLLPGWNAAALSAPAAAPSGRLCHAAVCVVDAVALSMDWYLMCAQDERRTRKRVRAEDAPSVSILQLQGLLQSIRSQQRHAHYNHSTACSRLLVGASQLEGTPLAAVVTEFVQTNGMELLELQSVDQADAEHAIQRLLANSASLQGAKRMMTSGDGDRTYLLCVAAVYEVLKQRTTFLQDGERFEGRFAFKVHDTTAPTFMRINRAAKEAFVASLDAKRPSLLKLLVPSCSTKRGRQCLQQWMKRPCVDVDTLRERHDAVEAILSALPEGIPAHSATGSALWFLSELFRHFQAYERQLASFSSISDTTDNSTSYRPSLADFDDLWIWLDKLRNLMEAYVPKLDDTHPVDRLRIAQLRSIRSMCCHDFQPLCDLIQQTIARAKDGDGNHSEIDSSNDIDGSTSNLQDLRAEARRCELEIETAVNQVAALLRLARSRIKTVFDSDEQTIFSGVGVMLRVSRQDSHRVQQQSGKGLTVFRASRASGVWFSTPEIDSLGAKWKALRHSYETAEADLAEFLASKLESNFPGLLGELEIAIAELDVLVSFALVSHKQKFTRATIWGLRADQIDGGKHHFLRLEDTFDPFTKNGATDAGHAIENSHSHSIELSYHEGKTFVLLPGDRNASHAMLLRRLGCIALLNQIGCFVPCQNAELPVFDAIHLRTGAYDQQLHGFSTFMTEMQEMNRIFESMTPASLVLVEDLCRGTSTTDGLALALSLCLHLMETRVTTCFSSQWHELTDQLRIQAAAVIPLSECRIFREVNADDTVGNSGCRCGQHQSLEKLMIDCDLPPDLIELVRQEIRQESPRVHAVDHLDHNEE